MLIQGKDFQDVTKATMRKKLFGPVGIGGVDFSLYSWDVLKADIFSQESSASLCTASFQEIDVQS